MPNLCNNTLFLTKDTLPIIVKNYIREDEHGNDIFDFERIIPIGDVSDWYEQRINKWGTKWIGYDLNIGEYIIDFYTAWAPPVGIIKRLAELHKDIAFRLEYYECGLAYRGITTAKWQDDEVLFDDHYWDMTDEDLKELGLIDESQDEEVKQGGKLCISTLYYWLKRKISKLLKL